jgi:hypothetical protein
MPIKCRNVQARPRSADVGTYLREEIRAESLTKNESRRADDGVEILPPRDFFRELWAGNLLD